jgi:hypothetical protein
MSRKLIGALLCGAVALGAIEAGVTAAKADQQDVILQRLDALEKARSALEKENATLKDRLRRVEGTRAAPTGRAPASGSATAQTVEQGPQGAMARGSMAAPMPTKAPVAFLHVCDRYGPGFYNIPGIPGMDGCLKVGGYIRAQGAWGASGDGIPVGADAMAPQGRQTRINFNDANYDARAVMSLDARVMTGWGDLRGYARFGAEVNTPFGNSISPNLQNNPVVFWDRGFIQFAGGTIGKARSFFDLFSLTDGFLTYGNPRASGDTDLYGVVLAGYTARFGNGFSASVSVEDPNGHNKTGPIDLNSSAIGLGTLTTAQLGGEGLNLRGYSVPDIIGNLRVDQSWGFAGVSGAIHQVAPGYYSGPSIAGFGAGCSGPCPNFGRPSDRYGWAFAGGGEVIIPGTLRDTIGANFVISEGAVGFATRGALWQIYGRGNHAGFGWAADGVFDNITPNCAAGPGNCPSSIELTQAWSVNAAYQHIWDPQWKTSAYGSFAAINYNHTATNIINQHLPGTAGSLVCGVPVEGAVQPPLNVGTGAGNSCSPNFSFWTIGSRTNYSPFPWLDLGVDVFYTHLNSAYKGVGVILSANGARPSGVYTIDDQNVLSVLARAQISFNP